MLRPFGRRHFHCSFSEHALRRRIEDEEVIVLVRDNDGIAHVRQDRAQDFVGAGEFGSAARYFLLQLVAVLTQCLLQFPLLGNVSVSPEPTDNSTFCVFNRKRARQKPPVFTTLTSQGKRIFPWDAGREGRFNSFDDSTDFVRMMDFLPAPTLHVFERGAGIVVPAIIVPKDVTLTIRHPG
jgi:hypothetical protein